MRFAAIIVLVLSGWLFFDSGKGRVEQVTVEPSTPAGDSKSTSAAKLPGHTERAAPEGHGKPDTEHVSRDIPDDRPLPQSKRNKDGIFARTLGEHFRSHPSTVERIMHIRRLGAAARNETPASGTAGNWEKGESDPVDLAVEWKNIATRIGSEIFADVVGHLSVDEEWELGDVVHKQLLETMEIDQAETERIEKLAAPILSHLVRTKGKKYTFTVIRDEQVNAFAHHGGHVYIKSGLLKVMQYDHELLFVLGHEVGHIERGHCAKSALSTQVAKQTFGGFGELPASLLQRFVGLSYSEFDEHDADAWSYKTLRKLGLSEQDIVEFFHTLLQLESQPAETPGG